MYKKGYIIWLFSLWVCASTQADDPGEPVVLADPENIYAIGKNLFLLEDPAHKNDEFERSQDDVPNFGAGVSVVWSKFTLQNTTSEDWYLEIETPYLNQVDLYSIDDQGRIEHISSGLDVDFKTRPVKVTTFIFPLKLRQGEKKTYHLRVYSESTLKLVLQVASLKRFYEVNSGKDLAHGVYFGLVLALSIYNLFVFLVIRDRTYLYYVLYISFTAMVIAWLRGFSHEFLLQNSPYLNEGNYFAAITFIFFALFSINFLQLDVYAPKRKKLAWYFFIISTCVIVLTLFRQRVYGFYGVVLMVNAIIPFVLIVGITAWRRGFSPAKYFLLGFCVFTVGDVVFVLKDLAVIPRVFFTEYAFEIGSSIEAIILSFALANKLNTLKREKEELQAKALQQANEFSKQLIQSQENERLLIAGELQDSIGHNLNALKKQVEQLQEDSPGRPSQSIESITELIDHTKQEVRSISYGLRPYQLDLLGITHALKSLVSETSESSGIRLEAEIDYIDNLFEKETEINLFRIIQECLNNMVKHSKASRGKVKISLSRDFVGALIEDNGVGMKEGSEGKGFGLIGIKERVNLLNGKAHIISDLNSGTSVAIKIYINAQRLGEPVVNEHEGRLPAMEDAT